MKKLLTMVLLMMATTMQAQQKEISHIETTKNWYYIYDESGKKIKTLYRSGIGDIKGWGKDFFVTKRGAYYLICDSEGKTLKTLGSTIGRRSNFCFKQYFHQPPRSVDIYMEQRGGKDPYEGCTIKKLAFLLNFSAKVSILMSETIKRRIINNE